MGATTSTASVVVGISAASVVVDESVVLDWFAESVVVDASEEPADVASSDWLVSGTLTTFTSGGTELVSYGQSAMLLALYAAAFVVATVVVFQRRDITA